MGHTGLPCHLSYPYGVGSPYPPYTIHTGWTPYGYDGREGPYHVYLWDIGYGISWHLYVTSHTGYGGWGTP